MSETNEPRFDKWFKIVWAPQARSQWYSLLRLSLEKEEIVRKTTDGKYRLSSGRLGNQNG